MSDPTEEDSLISQDDIDALLDASSIEEAEEILEAVEDEDNDLGELSQDDIDSLLNGSPAQEDQEESLDTGGELSQDDIDSLMGGGGSQDDEGGELSQDDIDSLMNGPADDDVDNDDGDSDDEDLELISQDDIDRLMNPSEDEADDELISMDDIQGAIEQAEGNDGESEPYLPSDEASELIGPDAPDEDIPGDSDAQDSAEPVSGADTLENDPFDDAIEENQALDVTGCLLTQETMDELIRNGIDSGNAPASDVDAPDQVNLDEEQPPEISASIEEDDGDGALEDELPDDFDEMLDGGDDSDVTQGDIDALLQESDDEDDFIDDDILISQDDIDTLLMAADQEDEDVLGDEFMSDSDGDLDDFDSEDFLDDDVFSESDAGADQVVLEGADAAVETDDSVSLSKRGKLGKILKSKLVLAAVSGILVLGISVPTVYFMFFSQKTAPLPEKGKIPLAGREVDVQSISVEEMSLQLPVRTSGTITLSDFIILASDQSKNMTYIHADISIDYSDQRAYHEINNNSSFYRDLIYESIQTRLVSDKQNEVTKADLIWGVETSLKKVLPPHYIQKISFKTFKTS